MKRIMKDSKKDKEFKELLDVLVPTLKQMNQGMWDARLALVRLRALNVQPDYVRELATSAGLQTEADIEKFCAADTEEKMAPFVEGICHAMARQQG